jgi:hypothetical protein
MRLLDACANWRMKQRTVKRGSKQMQTYLLERRAMSLKNFRLYATSNARDNSTERLEKLIAVNHRKSVADVTLAVTQ